MKILITGSNGFIGKNLVHHLKQNGYTDLLLYDLKTKKEQLNEYASKCDFVFHLAGVNRPKSDDEFKTGNYDFTKELLSYLEKYNNNCPVLITSSIQASLDNPYGISKRGQEELLFDYHKSTGNKVFVFRLENVFGKWSRPNYNSVIATFCYNISRDLPIKVNDENVELSFIYIDDVISSFIKVLKGEVIKENNYCKVEPVYRIKLGKVASLIQSFKESRGNLSLPNLADDFEKKLYSTYLSFLPSDKFSYNLKMSEDQRGSFTEVIRTLEKGQFSINVTKAGITKGNHWHHTKTEKFLVVSGKALIQFRKIDAREIIEYQVSSDNFEVVDIPPGYTHNIINIGEDDLITFMWANESYNPDYPDTISEKV